MNERVMQFRVGVVVLATFLIAAILVFLFGDTGALLEDSYVVSMRFTRAPGVSVESPVRKSGILIGRVKRVELIEEGGVWVTAKIKSSAPIFENDVCKISSGSLLGDSFIEFVQQDQPAARIEDGFVVGEGVSPVSILDMISNFEDDLERAMNSFTSAGDALTVASKDVGVLAKNLNKLLADEDNRLGNLLTKTESALDGFSKTMQSIDSVIGDETTRAKLRESIAQLPDTLNEARDMIASLQTMATSADANLQNLKGFTEPLGENGPQLVASIQESVEQLDELLEMFTDFGDALNSSEGSLGQLVHNPDLYQNLNRAAENIQIATGQLQPILNDVRVFADKIARDPGRIGVSGALQRRAGIK